MNKIITHVCDELKQDEEGLKSSIGKEWYIHISYFESQHLWALSLKDHPDLIIKFCPYCGLKLSN